MAEMIDSKLDEIKTALVNNKCFTVKGHFKELYDLGFYQQADNNPDFVKDDENPNFFLNIYNLINEQHSELTEYDYTFYKIIGDEVIELYLKECSKDYGYKGKEREYVLAFKGLYYLDTFKLVPSKKPSIIAYNWYGQPTLMVTIRGPETEWFITSHASAADYFGKFFDSDLYFGLSRVDYDSDTKTITDVYFKVGDRLITSVELAEVVPALKDCSYLKLLNWKKYVTQDHITILEMSLI